MNTPKKASHKSWLARNWFFLVACASIAVIVAGLTFLWIEENTQVWGGPCQPVGLWHEDLVVVCEGQKHVLSSSRNLALSYAINPGPLECTRYQTGKVSCKQRPFK